jgi:hypothetical protein
VAALVAAFIAFALGLAVEDDCSDSLGFNEVSRFESTDYVAFQTCSETLPNGRVIEAEEIRWYAFGLAIPAGVGAWFAVAGLLGVVGGRRALTTVAACAALFLVVNAIFFIGVFDEERPMPLTILTRP